MEIELRDGMKLIPSHQPCNWNLRKVKAHLHIYFSPSPSSLLNKSSFVQEVLYCQFLCIENKGLLNRSLCMSLFPCVWALLPTMCSFHLQSLILHHIPLFNKSSFVNVVLYFQFLCIENNNGSFGSWQPTSYPIMPLFSRVWAFLPTMWASPTQACGLSCVSLGWKKPKKKNSRNLCRQIGTKCRLAVAVIHISVFLVSAWFKYNIIHLSISRVHLRRFGINFPVRVLKSIIVDIEFITTRLSQ